MLVGFLACGEGFTIDDLVDLINKQEQVCAFLVNPTYAKDSFLTPRSCKTGSPFLSRPES